MHDINSAKGWSLMSSSFRKSFLTHLLIGGVIGILYFIFSHSSFFMNRLINSLFLASFFPLIFGGLRFVKISEPLTCLFTAIENSGSTGNTMKNLKKKMRRLPRLPHLNSDPTTNTAIPGTYFHPVRDRFWPAAYISFCRCF